MEEERIKLQKQKYGPKPIVNLTDESEFPLLSTPPKHSVDSNSDNDKLSDNSPVISSKYRNKSAHKSWSEITVNKKALGMESSNIQTFVTPNTSYYSNSSNSNSNNNSNSKK